MGVNTSNLNEPISSGDWTVVDRSDLDFHLSRFQQVYYDINSDCSFKGTRGISTRTDSDLTKPLQILNTAQRNGLNKITNQCIVTIKEQLGIHCNITCAICSEDEFRGYRFKCVICTDFNICGNCFEDRLEVENHSKSHPVICINLPNILPDSIINFLEYGGLSATDSKLSSIVHPDTFCSACSTQIHGIRIKCDDCVDYDLCFQCYNSESFTLEHKSDHSVLVHLVPLQYEISLRDVRIDEKLGQGKFGGVYSGMLKDRRVACKLLMYDVKKSENKGSKFDIEMQVNSLRNESRIYRELCSNHIINYYGFCEKTEDLEDRKRGVYLICLEYMEKGTLEDQVHRKEGTPRLALLRKFKLMHGLLRGLERLHRKGITHKDLKLDNLFIDSFNDIKIGDLGIAIAPNQPASSIGNIRQKIYYPLSDCQITIASDMYSFGLILNEVITEKKHRMFMGRQVQLEHSPYFSAVIKLCTSDRDKERPTAQEVRSYFDSFFAFFKEYLGERGYRTYSNLSLDKKDELFRLCYIEFIKKHGLFQKKEVITRL